MLSENIKNSWSDSNGQVSLIMVTSNNKNSEDIEFEMFQKMKQKSDEELYQVILHGNCYEKHAARIHLTTRGAKSTFIKAVEFCKSDNPAVRTEAALILGQLGTPDRPFRKESFPILTALLENDAESTVRAAAAAALGHLNDTRAISYLIKSAEDPSAEVRHDTAFALGCFDSPEVVESLIKLSDDTDKDVRNWATFGLGTCIDSDTNEIRDALFCRLSETDPEIRGEALIGLAKRKDESVIKPLIQELSGEFYGSWSLEAAELMANSLFYPYLISLRNCMEGEVENRFIESLDDAIAACKQSNET